ncbi:MULTISPECIES: helix-turn-helix transcriptional regulator [Vagococcus]|uniref:Transcriptional regulator, XRE family n=1 Tax=Vagococcus fluvialis bH819 TaxID=1255619 RepID=A0A1X6WL21_9ENTE|nr:MULTISPECIES: helix-turn-helix transcriptional regulator [Vagococcus]SLM84950.1 Transcriptional regulator, XRE family [Vagococcus fluvialis bH819]HCM90489.1 XRE family transcriptional regulator [Vagococcus sp.]
MSLGEQLKNSRLKKNLSQTDVSNHLNISRQSISKWETNRTYPSLENLLRLSMLYDISPNDLIQYYEVAQSKNKEA